MRYFGFIIVVASAIALGGCDNSSSSSPSGPSATPPPLTNVASVIVAGTPPAVGSASQFTAIAVTTDGTSVPVTSQATWSSADTSIATVSSDGMVKAIKAGSAEISATYASKKGALAFTVVAPAMFTVTGTVRDAASGGALSAASITVKDSAGVTKTAATDGTGRYSVAGVAGGPVDVTAAMPNYVATTRSITLFGDLTIDFSLSRGTSCPVIGFDNLSVHGAAFTSYSACGLTVTATQASWTVSTTYGHPAPFVLFTAAAGTTTAGEVIVTAAGAKFKFQSVDIYSSTTVIPYVITGIANGATVFTIQNTQGNTFGNFATVVNPQPTTPIEALLIRLTNPAAPCCSNPMGLDNIVVAF